MTDSSPLPNLGRYRLRYRVASGGMASVYLAQLATDAGFSKWVAIKIIHSHIAEDKRFVEMFLDEARLAAKLDHPNICTVFDFGQAEGTYYIAMEYLHGESLDRLARRVVKSGGAVDSRVAARIVCDAARGLHHAHELKMDDGRPAGVVHRDVSPQNVFVLYSGVTKVVDFGIARSAERAADKTRTGELKGKLAYMSPEQIASPDHVDRRTDVWALGVVLWEITLGRRLFRRTNPAATVAAISQPVPRPRDLDPSYPEGLERIVLKALSQDLTARHPSASELARDLERWVASSGEPCSAEDVAAYVTASFPDAKHDRERMLAEEPTTVSGVPDFIEAPSETELPLIESAPRETPAPRAVAVEPRSSGRRWLLPLVILLSTAGGFLVALQVMTPSEPPSAQETSHASSSAAAPPPDERAAPVADVVVDAGSAEVRPGSEDDAGAEPSVAAEAPPQPPPEPIAQRARARPEPRARAPRTPSNGRDAPSEAVPGAFGTVAVSTTPSGLAVYRGAQLLGRTPFQHRLPVGSHTLRVVSADGESHRVPVVVEPYATSVVSLTVR